MVDWRKLGKDVSVLGLGYLLGPDEPKVALDRSKSENQSPSGNPVKQPNASSTDEQSYVHLLAVGGHVAAGKSAFTEKLTERMGLENLPIQFTRTSKLRPPRPAEIDGIDYTEIKGKAKYEAMVNSGEIVVPFERGGVKYGFPRSLLTALEENIVHQIVNLDISGLVALKTHFQQNSIRNRIISIGLYCGSEEAQPRIIGREDLTQEQVESIYSQLSTLPNQMTRYRKNPNQFRYFFHNTNPLATLDHLVDRTMDLFDRESEYSNLNETEFHQKYVEDQCIAMFGMGPEALEEKIESGEKIKLLFNEGDFSEYGNRFGLENKHGPITKDDLRKVSDSEVSKVVNAYGILNILLYNSETDTLSSEERVRNRVILQNLLQIRLGVPQYMRTKETISVKNMSRYGLIQSGDSLLSFLISFSPYDIFPLAVSPEHIPNVKATPHTLSFESVYKRGKELDVRPLPIEVVASYANNHSSRM